MFCMQSIEADFGRVHFLREQLCELANRIQTMSSDEISPMIEATRRVWKDEGSRSFLEKEVKVNESIKSEAEILSDIAEDLNCAAEDLYRQETDNVALGLFRRY